MTWRCLIDPELRVLANFDREQVENVGFSMESGNLHSEAPFDCGKFSSKYAF